MRPLNLSDAKLLSAAIREALPKDLPVGVSANLTLIGHNTRLDLIISGNPPFNRIYVAVDGESFEFIGHPEMDPPE